MYTHIFVSGVLLMVFSMVIAKRMTSLINSFGLQSFFLFMVTLFTAIEGKNLELYVVALLLFLIKVVIIPRFLRRIVRSISVSENVGLFVNPLLSLCIALLLTYLGYLFTKRLMPVHNRLQGFSFAVSFSVMLIGMFIMVCRKKALTQIIGLLVMENGLFLAAASVSGGMPFFVEIAIFFDIFVCVIILGVFVFKINSLFTHIDVNKLTRLKG
ncbi:MAG: hydrogenase [Candidatus Omnitrophica bacterium]|nr:hydrogenase [Candidatus Omnitrophota bacterium]